MAKGMCYALQRSHNENEASSTRGVNSRIEILLSPWKQRISYPRALRKGPLPLKKEIYLLRRTKDTATPSRSIVAMQVFAC